MLGEHRTGSTGLSCLKDKLKVPSLRKEGKAPQWKEIDKIIIDCTCVY